MISEKDWVWLPIEAWMELEAQMKLLAIRQAVKDKPMQERFDNGTYNQYMGLIGELAFEDYLKSQNIKYEKDQAIGRADKFDFKMNGKLIDVKTSPVNDDGEVHKYVLYNLDQAEEKIYDIAIFLKFHETERMIIILGWQTSEYIDRLIGHDEYDSTAKRLQWTTLFSIDRLIA